MTGINGNQESDDGSIIAIYSCPEINCLTTWGFTEHLHQSKIVHKGIEHKRQSIKHKTLFIPYKMKLLQTKRTGACT